MSSPNTRRIGKKRGRFFPILFIGLGCLAVLAGSAWALWRGFLRGEPAPAWNEAPASTAWLAEIRGLGELARRLNGNSAAREVAAAVRDHFGLGLFSPGQPSPVPFAWREFIPDWLVYPLLPESVWLGGLWGPSEGEAASFFLLLRLGRLPAWLLEKPASAGSAGRVSYYGFPGGRGFFFAVRDGWLLVSGARRPAEEFAAGDRTGIFSPGSVQSAPGLALAWKQERERPVPVPSGPPDLPFFGLPPVPGSEAPLLPAEAPAGETVVHRLIAGRIAGGWEAAFFFNLAPGETPDESQSLRPGRRELAGADLSAFARLSPGFKSACLEAGENFLRTGWPDALTLAGINPGAWLLDAWLARTAADFQLRLNRPAAPEAAGVPPLPVIGLGWFWQADGRGGTPALDFAAGLADFIGSLANPSAPFPLPALKDSLVYENRRVGGEMRGRLVIPPVVANSLRPAWRLALENPAGMSWLASDPAGLPDKSPEGSPAGGPPEPEENGAVIMADWRLSPEFRDGLLKLARDRLETFSERPPENYPECLELADRLLEFAASGSLAWRIGGGGKSRLKVRLDDD
ncbi:MAG: hypothetical protein LBU64_07440 [Planctomycetota bacterium]|jgi:hypothetical protein|nr:hypothetical protein [Planctomycetota bacterium]